jgi:hypothetical protein
MRRLRGRPSSAYTGTGRLAAHRVALVRDMSGRAVIINDQMYIQMLRNVRL